MRPDMHTYYSWRQYIKRVGFLNPKKIYIFTNLLIGECLGLKEMIFHYAHGVIPEQAGIHLGERHI